MMVPFSFSKKMVSQFTVKKMSSSLARVNPFLLAYGITVAIASLQPNIKGNGNPESHPNKQAFSSNKPTVSTTYLLPSKLANGCMSSAGILSNLHGSNQS